MNKFTPTRRQLIISGIGISLAGCLEQDQTNDETDGEDPSDENTDQEESDDPEVLTEEDVADEEEIVQPEEGELTDQFLSLYDSTYTQVNDVINLLSDAYSYYDSRQFEDAQRAVLRATSLLDTVTTVYNQERNQQIIDLHRESTPRVQYPLDNLELMFVQLEQAITYFEEAENSRDQYDVYKRKLENANAAISYAESLTPTQPSRL